MAPTEPSSDTLTLTWQVLAPIAGLVKRSDASDEKAAARKAPYSGIKLAARSPPSVLSKCRRCTATAGSPGAACAISYMRLYRRSCQGRCHVARVEGKGDKVDGVIKEGEPLLKNLGKAHRSCTEERQAFKA